MAVDLDWLVSRFDRVSIDYPGLALVGVPAPSRFTKSNSFVDASIDSYHPEIRHTKYEPQWYWAEKTPEFNSTKIITISLKHHLRFPYWKFRHSLPVFKRGWWAMWLHRTFGFDPSNVEPNQQIQSNSECLQAYQPLFELATQALVDHYGNREWFIEWCLDTTCGNEKYNLCGPWLLFLLSHYPSRKEWDVQVIDDIGIATVHALRTLGNAITPAVGLSPPSELPTSADVPPSPYQTLWDYAQRMWASDTDKFKICQHISSGPGNYSACVEELVPGVDGRTLKTNRFHAVLGVLNKEIGAELRLEVYRFGEQILVCERGRKPTGHKRKSKKTTTKKTTTKRKK